MLDLEQVKRAREALDQGNAFAALEYLDAFLKKHEHELSEKVIIDKAEELRRHKYRASVEHAVKTLFEEWKDGTYSGREDEARQALDNVAEVSHYDDAHDILIFSNNDGEAGELDWSGRDGIPWCEMAHYVLRADIAEGLKEDHGIDIFSEPPKEPVEKCSYCDEWKPAKGFKDGNCEDCQEV